MAARRKPPAKTIKFELTLSGIAGIGVVCFCIFLWMFLLGVWTGQSLLLPSPGASKSVARQSESDPKQDTTLIHIEQVVRKKTRAE